MDFLVDRIEQLFTGIGGTFLISPKVIEEKLRGVKAFIFDWDGVFNNGEKNENGSSNFNEVDSMGINMLRFSFWLLNEELPFTAIISGERNKASFYFCEREHFHGCYFRVMNKLEALEHFCHLHSLKHEEVAYVFDDVLDISIADVCGLSILVKRKSNPLFIEYIKTNKLADYITGAESGNFAVRESCELLMGINGRYEEAISSRSSNADNYKEYLGARNGIATGFYSAVAGKIVTQHPGS